MRPTRYDTARSEREVVIAGGGPTGMMLAAELTLAGTDVVVVERRPNSELESPRSRGLHARTIEVLDQRGIAQRFLAAGTAVQVQSFAGVPLDISDFPTRHNYGLALLQSDFERILSGWIEELDIDIIREQEIVGFVQDSDGVDVALSNGATIRAHYLVGCDGGRSFVRKSAGIEFAGWDPTTCWITTEVETTEQPPFGLRGGGGIGPAQDGRVGVTLIEPDVERHSDAPTIDDVRAALIRVDGTDYGARNPKYISRFTDMTRQAVSYRVGRVLLAGDAAHVHAPLGGQGLNLGVQDAVNLGWKLSQVTKGMSPVSLLDTYEKERHPVAARVLNNTMAQRSLGTADDRSGALRELIVGLLNMDEPRKQLAGVISGLDIHYDLGPGHPLVGRRIPDLDITPNDITSNDIISDNVAAADQSTRIFDYLHDGKAVLLHLDGPALDISAWDDRVQVVNAAHTGAWELPVLGHVEPPAAVLIRPDGYVAWVGTGTDIGLREALTTWFGTRPTPP